MAEVVSPTVARRRVRLALREAREAAGRTQLEVAEEMEWSLSKVIRIENGEVSISPNDLRPLLAYLGIKDRAQVGALIADAKIARSRQHGSWWQAAEFRALTDELRRYIEYEAVATAVHSFAIRYVSGPLQTPEYAAALTGSFDIELEEAHADVVVKARQLRRDAVLTRLGDLKFYAVFDESVFMRPIGGPSVFAGQLQDLYRLASQRLIHLRMLPFEMTAPIANNASFDLVKLGDDQDDDGNEVLYRENGLVDELIEDRASTRRHLNRFHQLWNMAADEDDTIAYIGRRIEVLENNRAS